MRIIDIHMHVIPGVDDGSNSMEESITMLKLAAEQGVSAIIATPHSWALNKYGIELDVRFEELKQAAIDHRIPIQLYLGCEMLVNHNTLEDCIWRLSRGHFPTLANSSYVLAEFEPNASQQDMKMYVERLLSEGYIPIIAHAERYENTTVAGVRELKKLGAMVQINAYSVANEPKAHTRETANALLSEELVDYIGSDAHRLDHRPPVISDGISALAKRYGERYAKQITETHPRFILQNLNNLKNEKERKIRQ